MNSRAILGRGAIVGLSVARTMLVRLRWGTDVERIAGDLRTSVAGAVVSIGLATWPHQRGAD